MYRHLQKAQIYYLSFLLCTSVWILNLYPHFRALLCETELEFRCHKLLLQAIVLPLDLTDHIHIGWTEDITDDKSLEPVLAALFLQATYCIMGCQTWADCPISLLLTSSEPHRRNYERRNHCCRLIVKNLNQCWNFSTIYGG
jgi:hypothetical protein